MTSMEIKGHTGTVTFDGTSVTITRTGFLARATVGKGSKRIPISHLTAVQFKPAGAMTNGFIQFTLSGGNERRSRFGKQTQDAAKDENSVIFTRSQQSGFEQLRSAVEAAMVAPTLNGGGGQPDAVDQLRRLAELRDAGVITNQEFDTTKGRLLGGITS